MYGPCPSQALGLKLQAQQGPEVGGDLELVAAGMEQGMDGPRPEKGIPANILWWPRPATESMNATA